MLAYGSCGAADCVLYHCWCYKDNPTGHVRQSIHPYAHMTCEAMPCWPQWAGCELLMWAHLGSESAKDPASTMSMHAGIGAGSRNLPHHTPRADAISCCAAGAKRAGAELLQAHQAWGGAGPVRSCSTDAGQALAAADMGACDSCRWSCDSSEGVRRVFKLTILLLACKH